MKNIRKTAIVMLLCLYFLTYGVLPQVQAAGKDAPVIVVAHRAGAKVAPENTVAALEQAIRSVAASGADAVICQDLAVATLIGKIAPQLPRHGSTQMSVHTLQGALELKELGFTRVVLARELSLAEIEAAEAGMPGLAELERIAAETVEKIPIRIGDDPEF